MFFQLNDPVAQLLSAAVSPMLVISAAGVLLVNMTNRYARVIDRARRYLEPSGSSSEIDDGLVREKVKLVWRRAMLLRLSIALTIFSVLCIVVTVFGLFLQQLTDLEMTWVVLFAFGVSLMTLGSALIVFLRDMALSLRVLELDIRERMDPESVIRRD